MQHACTRAQPCTSSVRAHACAGHPPPPRFGPPRRQGERCSLSSLRSGSDALHRLTPPAPTAASAAVAPPGPVSGPVPVPRRRRYRHHEQEEEAVPGHARAPGLRAGAGPRVSCPLTPRARPGPAPPRFPLRTPWASRPPHPILSVQPEAFPVLLLRAGPHLGVRRAGLCPKASLEPGVGSGVL